MAICRKKAGKISGWITLFYVFLCCVPTIAMFGIFNAKITSDARIAGPLITIALLSLFPFIYFIALNIILTILSFKKIIQRLQKIDHSAFLVVLTLIPFGIFILLYFLSFTKVEKEATQKI